MKSFFYATAMLVGTIIGVGIFGIPYASSRAGFWLGEAYIVGLLFLVLLLHLCYGEIVERTQAPHRAVGYAQKYVGEKMKYIASFLVFGGEYAALLLYLVAAGQFLSILTFGQIAPFWGSILFWMLGVCILWRGLRFIAQGELLMVGFFILAIGIVVGRGIPLVQSANLTPTNPSQLFLPYGVILFALLGISIIPDMRAVLGDGKRYAWAIIVGTVIPAIVYLLFNFAVVGMAGTHTSPEAIEGIVPIVGDSIGWVGALAGLLAVFMPSMATGINLRNTFILDWGAHKAAATALVAGIPGILFLLGFKGFIVIMSIAGAVFGAGVSIMVLFIYLRARQLGDRKPAFSFELPAPVVYTIGAAMAVAGVYQIVYWIR